MISSSSCSNVVTRPPSILLMSCATSCGQAPHRGTLPPIACPLVGGTDLNDCQYLPVRTLDRHAQDAAGAISGLLVESLVEPLVLENETVHHHAPGCESVGNAAPRQKGREGVHLAYRVRVLHIEQFAGGCDGTCDALVDWNSNVYFALAAGAAGERPTVARERVGSGHTRGGTAAVRPRTCSEVSSCDWWSTRNRVQRSASTSEWARWSGVGHGAWVKAPRRAERREGSFTQDTCVMVNIRELTLRSFCRLRTSSSTLRTRADALSERR